MLKLYLSSIIMIITVILINLTSPCLAHQPLLGGIFLSNSEQYDFCEVGKVYDGVNKLGKAIKARDDEPEPPPPPHPPKPLLPF